MRSPLLSRKSFMFFAMCLAVALSLPLSGREVKITAHRVPSFRDWSTRHLVYPAYGTLGALRAVQNDPRAQFAWREFDQRHGRSLPIFRQRGSIFGVPGGRGNQIARDWSISLGGGTTAPGQFPAKFGFDVNAPPSCTADFVVFPVNVNGSATQPDIVAFNNLYSGTAAAGGVGICNRIPPPAGDNGTAATVLWSYNVHSIAAGGAVPTSPALSLDGTKVAFVESAAGNPAHFHVLAWASGDGKNAANLQSVTSPKAITVFSATAPAAGSGTATNLTLGASGTDTLSSPFIDYTDDLAYVGNDVGVLYRIKNVFCITSSCGNAAPSLDTSWGGSGSVAVGWAPN